VLIGDSRRRNNGQVKEYLPPNEHVKNGASTPEATPRLYAVGAGGATTAKTCDCAVCAAKLRQILQLFEGTSPREVPCFSADEAGIIYSFFCSSDESSSPAATAPRRRRQRSGHRPGHHDQERANMLITGRRRRRPRRGFMPQAQSTQQRLNRASAPPGYG
jgi:hypothetical protein